MSTGRSFTLDAWVCAQEGDETQTRVAIRYEPANPWSVCLTLRHENCTVIRHISRDIIREGFVAAIYPRYKSEQAIIVRPDCNDTMVEIVIPTLIAGIPDRLYVRVSKVELSLVLEEILKMVPPGDERGKFDWDRGMAHCEADAA